jgi:hypothetical protein
VHHLGVLHRLLYIISIICIFKTNIMVINLCNMGVSSSSNIIMLSASGPEGVLSQQVNQMLRVPNLDGDARRIHGGLS